MRGLTLLEVLIYVALLSLLFTGIFSSWTSLQEISNTNTARARLLEEELYIGTVLSQNVQAADSFDIPPTDSGSEIFSYVASTSRVELYASSSLMFRKEDGESDQLSDSDTSISNLMFTRNSSSENEIHISMTLSSYDGHKIISLPFNRTLFIHL